MKHISIALVTALSLSACSASGSETIDPTPLAGIVDGQSWTFQAGATDAFLSEGEDDFFAVLHASSFTPCGFSEPDGPHLIVSIPKTPGEYEMSLSLNMTFVVDNDNLVAFDGRIVVDEVTETSVSGGLVASYDGDNEVNGRFNVTICPED
jgi:hypothetical protein